MCAIIAVVKPSLQYLSTEKQIELLVTVVANLFSTIVGASLAFWFALRQIAIQSREAHRKTLVDVTFELHRKFNCSEMFETRGKADKLLQQHSTVRLDDLFDKLPETETRPIWILINFYQRLWFAIDSERADTKLASNLFGEIFYWWFINCFETQLLQVGWESRRDIQSLKNWFDVNSEQASRMAWLRRANLDKQKRLADSGNDVNS